MIVIALTGLARAGKDSVADVLVRDHGFTKLTFAAPVKRLLRELNPVIGFEHIVCDCGDMSDCPPTVEEVRLADAYAYGYTDETIKDSPWGDEIRDLWQRFATETIRTVDPDFWVDLARDEILESGAERVVFSDCRFPNEAEMIYNLNGPFFGDGQLIFSPFKSSVWEVSRPGLDPDDEHESERYAGLMEEEIQILNDGTLEELSGPVGVALRYITEDCFTGQGLLWMENLIEAGNE